MGRKRIERTVADKEKHKLLKREKRAEYRRQSRQNSKTFVLKEAIFSSNESGSNTKRSSFDILKSRLQNENVHHHFTQIARGSFHQRNEKFSELSRGKQCIANAAIAVAMSEVRSPILWSTEAIDDVLMIGDELYVNSINVRNETHPQMSHYEFLAVSELQLANILINSLSFDLKLGDIICGHRNVDNNEIGMPNLQNALCHLFANFHFGILTSNDVSVAIGKCDDKFWMFDSHSRNNHGKPCYDGKACLVLFASIQSLCALLTNNTQGRYDQYDLTPIIVVSKNEDRNRIAHNNNSLKRNKSDRLETVEDQNSKIMRIVQDKIVINLNNNYQITQKGKMICDNNDQHYAGPLNVLC